MSRREFAWRTYGEKVTFCCFWSEKVPTNHLTWRHGTQKVWKWRLMVKILREDMRDMLFLDVFNQANFKYTGHIFRTTLLHSRRKRPMSRGWLQRCLSSRKCYGRKSVRMWTKMWQWAKLFRVHILWFHKLVHYASRCNKGRVSRAM